MQRRAFIAAGSVSAGATAGAALLGRRAGAGPAAGRIPDVEVWTHEGRKLRFYDDLVKGRVVTLNFFFTTCGETCPLVTQNLAQLQDLLGPRCGRDVSMYSLTLQPEVDTPEVLRGYAEMYGVRPGWRFLTGAGADIELLRRRLGFASLDPELDVIKDEHTGLLRYGSDPLDRWAGCPALARPEWIVKALTASFGVPVAA